MEFLGIIEWEKKLDILEVEEIYKYLNNITLKALNEQTDLWTSPLSKEISLPEPYILYQQKFVNVYHRNLRIL